MDMHTSPESIPVQKLPIESLSKEELLSKYKGLLGIAKKAKQAKDEFAEENRQLKEAISRNETQKEADKKALVTMKEMIEEFTENKLSMVTQISELQQKDDEIISQLRIQNESLERQVERLNEDNESLLNDIDRMENRMNQVVLLGKDQKKSLDLLELQVNKLKEAEMQNAALQSELTKTVEENKLLKEQQNATTESLSELTEKYQGLKSINSDQRKKFNSLKDRFLEVLRKLKNLKECKRILLETQYEYSEAVSNWQNEIIKASHLLCAQLSSLKADNEELQRKLRAKNELNDNNQPTLVNIDNVIIKLNELQTLSEMAYEEHREQSVQYNISLEENKTLKEQLNRNSQMTEREEEPKEETRGAKENNILEIKCLSQELEDLKIKLQDKEEYIKALEQSNAEMKDHEEKPLEKIQVTQESSPTSEMSHLQAKIYAQKLEISDLRDEIHNMEIERNALLQKANDIDKITTDKEKLRTQLTELIEKIQQNAFDYDEKSNILTRQIEALELEKARLMEQIEISQNKDNEKLRTEIDRLQQQIHNDRQSYDELLTRYEQKEREHTDLLDEMRELNEALKARGDVISRQQEKQQELMAELKKMNAKLKQIDDKLNEKEQVIKQKEEEVRLVTKEVDETRTKVSKLETVCAENKEHVRNLTDEIQNLRNNFESSTQDVPQSDALSTSTISRADELSRLAELDDNYEEKYQKLRGLAIKLKKKLQEQTQIIGELEKQRADGVATLQIELDNCNKTISDLQHEREQSKKLIDTLKSENNKLKSSRKQSNVLNLEIEAAEKSLKDATTKLTEKSNKLEEMKELMKTKENTITQLRKEISILESAKEAECTHSRELKDQIDHLNNQLKDAVHSKQNALTANKELEQTQEGLKLELEEVRLQLADITSRHEKVLFAIKAEKEALQEQLLETKSNLDSVNSTLKLTERSLEDLRVEYVEYKVKAQAVLKKNQNTNTSKERELEEEVLTLHAAEKQLQAKLQTNLRKIEESEQRNQVLQVDNDTLQKRNRELLLVLDELRQQNESLSQDNHTEMQKHQESLKNQREQIENLDKCYKAQLQELETNYQKLKDEYAKVIRVPPTIGASKTLAAPPTNASQQQSHHQVLSTDQSKIDYLLMEREDAEGSEEAEALATIAANRKISNASRRRSQQHHDFLPLDELLNVPMNTFSDTVTTLSAADFQDNYYDIDDETNNNFKNVQLELQATKENMHIQETRVRHLTALLAENEQDLAKLTQMNDMLKEELRRQERAVEREKHMAENSEYLKNVIIKFVTLSNSDERTRLVPVLNTILRLSRAETEVLNCVAKGQKVPTDSNNRGWSDFLPKWNTNNN